MTLELILGVLFVGILGLIWALTIAILGDDQPVHNNQPEEAVASPVEPRRA